uniref:KIB1-4 beta-propeller domain-containing protein n=1 Tax=Aegilops tauschii TaxID=37682 RepID=N1QZ92_AEGTA
METGQHQGTGSAQEHRATTTRATDPASKTLTPPHLRPAAPQRKRRAERSHLSHPWATQRRDPIGRPELASIDPPCFPERETSSVLQHQEGDESNMSPSLPPATRSPWASLPEDMIRLVAGRLLAGDLTDYVRLRAVCTNWRSSTVSPRGRGVIDPRFHPRRWMMFAEGHGLHPGHENLCGHVRFFNLDSGIFVRVRLPLLTDHCVLDSVEGLLVLQRDEDTAIRLLHPFTGDIVELPPLTSLAMQLKADYTQATKLKLMRDMSASISVAADGVVRVMVLIGTTWAAVATSQDTEWTMLPWRIPGHYQPLSSGGKQYLVHDTFFEDSPEVSQIFQMEAHLQDAPKLIAAIPKKKLAYPLYLVECDSEVLVVGHKDRSFTHLAVHRLSDLVSRRYVPEQGTNVLAG